MTAKTILEDDILTELFDIESEVEHTQAVFKLEDRALELGVKTKFKKLYTAYKNDFKKYLEEQPLIVDDSEKSNITNFNSPYPELKCGNWECDFKGVKTYVNNGNSSGYARACYSPVLPIKRLINLQTGDEKTIIAFRKDNCWKEIVVENGVLLNANKIITIVKSGIMFSSENTKYLARYFTETLTMNPDIPLQMSTSKMGWLDDYNSFMPFIDNEIVFDSESCFSSVFNAISEHGKRDKYITLIKDVRKRDRKEPMLLVATSLASVLVKPLGLLPFIFHLYGEAGKGKTVATMLAASIWGDPSEDGYMSDPKNTATVFEIYLDFLNNLPFICDDMSKLKRVMSSQKKGDFSDFIYFLAGGTGKKRSNVNLGVNKVTSWKNCSITNAEKPLTSETSNGGELLRVIELETAPGVIFDDGTSGKLTADTIRENYGFIGKEFIKIILEIGFDKIKQIHTEFVNKITDRDTTHEKEGKQIQPMALILTADKLLTDYILKDGVYLDFDFCYSLIRSNKAMSDNERAYEFIINEVAINRNNFRDDEIEPTQRWGYVDNGYYLINPNIFSGIAERGNFSKKMFIEWAVRNGLSQVNKGRLDKRVYGKGNFIFVKIPLEEPEDAEEPF